MSSGNKNIVPINWQEVPDKELGLDEADPEDVAMAKLQEKAHEAEVQHQEVAVIERQREAEWQREAERQEAKRAKEAKKQQCTKSEARPSSAQGQELKCVCVHTTKKNEGEKKKRMRRAWPIFDNDNIVVTSTHKARKLESGVQETMAQVVERRMGEVVKELWGLRKGVTTMAESNQDLAWVLYHRFQSVDTLVDEVQIFGAEGFLPKLLPESEPTKDELQEALREVEELQEECLEWAMERLQMWK
ncbi:hypothetical protein ID866_11289, partial [Astraeus odoratus]